MRPTTLREFCERYRNGEFKSDDVNVQVEAGWYDWFCSDKQLHRRLQKIWKVLKGVTDDWLLDNFYVWFKNNCPVSYPLYDDVRFEPLDESLRNQQYLIVEIDCGFEDTKYAISTARNGYHTEFASDDICAVYDFLNHWHEQFEEKSEVENK
jgi:hypothetical protein